MWFFFLHSVKGRPGEPPEVPHVPVVLLAGPHGLAAPVCRASGHAARLCVAPPAAGPPPPQQAGAPRLRRQQDQEGPAQSDGLHGAPAHGPGEEIREAEVPLHA